MEHKKFEDRLMKEIFDLTRSFQTEFPIIYENLLETPLFLDYDHNDISVTEFEAYREFLKAQFRVLINEQQVGPRNRSNTL